MSAPPNYQAAEPALIEVPDTSFYKVEKSANHTDGCQHCGHDLMWTITYADRGEAIEIGTSWQGEEGLEIAEDICELMNMAYEAGNAARKETTENPAAGAPGGVGVTDLAARSAAPCFCYVVSGDNKYCPQHGSVGL